jgi:dUTP pyrophosphatase
MKVEVGIYKDTENESPKYATPGSSGVDIRASLGEPKVIKPGCRELIPTGLYLDIPEDYEIQVRPRSGLALKKGITVLNTPGTIDSDYTGEICVILMNLGDTDFTVNPGDRIAQAVLCYTPKIVWKELPEKPTKESRGSGGFGHSGVK